MSRMGNQMRRSSSVKRVRLFAERLDDRITPTAAQGQLEIVETIGTSVLVKGWAYDPDSTGQVSVHIYDGSTFIGDTVANINTGRTGLPRPGSEFQFTVPASSSVLDGNTHNLNAWAIDLAGGDPNQLLPGSPKTYRNQATVGRFDTITPGGEIKGWAYDPDNQFLSINIHVYIDGQLAATGVANQQRGDVNSTLGIQGDHGYSVPAPSWVYSTPAIRTVTVYAVDAQSPTASSLNTPLPYDQSQDSPALGPPSLITVRPHVFWGDAAIQGANVAGLGPVTVGTMGRYSGAISSIKYAGKEFVDSFDHGRQAQTALFGAPGRALTDPNVLSNPAYWDVSDPSQPGYGPPSFSEPGKFRRSTYNPTEAGSASDAHNPTTTSTLYGLTKTQTNELQTNGRMAYWDRPGLSSGQGPAYNTATDGEPGSNGIRSLYDLQKTVTVGAYGFENVIRNRTTINIPAADDLRYIQLYPSVVYTHLFLENDEAYNENTRAIEPILGNANATGYPYDGQLAFAGRKLANVRVKTSGPATTDYAIAVVSQPAPGSRIIPGVLEAGRYATPGYLDTHGVDTDKLSLVLPRDLNVPDSPVIMNERYSLLIPAFNYSVPANLPQGVVSGAYTFDTYIIVGTRETVRSTLSNLQNANPSLFAGVTSSASSNVGTTGSWEPVAAETSVNALDLNPATKWITSTQPLQVGNVNGQVASGVAWLKYEVSTPRPITQISLTSANDSPGRDPKNWKVLGSLDGINWGVVSVQTNQTFAGRNTTNTYFVPTTLSYRYYMLLIEANNGDTNTAFGGAGLVQLSEFRVS